MLHHRRTSLLPHFLALLLVLTAPGIGLLHSQEVFSKGGGNPNSPPSYGDPDQPTVGFPRIGVGGGPESTGHNPNGSGTSYNGQFGGIQVIGRNDDGLWSWRLRFLIAGLRSYFLRL